jgi:hypothetical protein
MHTLTAVPKRPFAYALQRFRPVSGITTLPNESQTVIYAKRYEELLARCVLFLLLKGYQQLFALDTFDRP